jgi:hypothetical protein
MLKNSLSFNLGSKNPYNILNYKKKTFGNHVSWDFHQIKGNTKSFGFTCEWQNKPNSFFNILCKMVAFHEVIAPKMNHHQCVVLVKPSMVGFRKRKATTNNGNRILLSYLATICITFAHPTNTFNVNAHYNVCNLREI